MCKITLIDFNRLMFVINIPPTRVMCPHNRLLFLIQVSGSRQRQVDGKCSGPNSNSAVIYQRHESSKIALGKNIQLAESTRNHEWKTFFFRVKGRRGTSYLHSP